MKVVVTGASGLLGRAIVRKFRQEDHQVHGIAFTRSDPPSVISLDLTDFQSVETYLDSIQPDLIIHTAAEKSPDVVAKDPQKANLLNVDVPSHLAGFCRDRLKSKPLFINISTDYVFDGNNPPYKVNDECNPLNDYGTSKLLAEREIIKNGGKGRATSLRVPILYGEAENPSESAVNVLMQTIKPSSMPVLMPVKCDAFSVRYPTNINDVSLCIYRLVTLTSQINLITLPPILHFQSKEAMTKFDIACVLDRVNNSILNRLEDVSDDYYQRFRTSVDHLEPEYSVDNTIPGTVARPKHCKMDMEELDLLGIEVNCVGFEEWWREYLTKQHEERIKQEKKEAEMRKVEEERELERIRIEREKEEEEKKKKAEEEKELERKRMEIEVEESRRRQEEESKLKQEEERKRTEEEERIKKEAEEKRVKDERRKELESEGKKDAAARGDQEQKEETGKSETEEKRTDEVSPSFESPRTEQTQDETVKSDPSSENQAAPTSTNEATSSSRGEDSSNNPLSPSSPNPSFSSLRARPTPPTTSLNSPTNSLPPSVYEGKIGEVINKEEKIDEGTASSFDSPLSLDAEEKQKKLGVKSNPKIETQNVNGSELFQDSNVLSSSTSPNPKDAGDADSDVYGQPSPKLTEFKEEELTRSVEDTPSIAEKDSATDSSDRIKTEHQEHSKPSEPNSLAKNGFGEVSFGLDQEESEPASAIDDQDDVPLSRNTNLIGIPRPPLPKPKDKAKEDDLPWFQVKVGDPIKVGDPVTAHIVYTVRTQTNSSLFKSQQFSVLRRYSDFRWLHAALVHCNPGIFIPPIPEKVKLGRFQPELIESRRIGLENAVNKMLKHRKLYKDEDLKMFLESENFSADVKAREAKKGAIPTPEQKTYFGWSSAITNNGPKFHEFDEWFDSQRMYLDSLESQLKQLVKAVSAVAQQRKELAAATSDFSSTLMALSFSSLSRSLSTCFAGLGELEKRNAELTDVQSDADVRQIGTVIYEYERMVGSVRKAFATRIDSWVSWQRANEEFSKQQARHEKLKRETNGRIHPDKLHTSLTDLSDAELKSLNLKREFENVSKNCKEEMDRFDKTKVEEFKQALEDWIDGMIQRQEEIIAEWEQYNALLDRQSGGARPPSSSQPSANSSNAQPIMSK